MEIFSSFIPYCKELNVKISIENVIKSKNFENCCSFEDLNKYVDTLNEQGENFVALVDVGHAEYSGYKADEFIRGVGGKRLKGLHIQDSDGVRDLHQLPFTQKFDWNAITKALADINYSGDFTFEAAQSVLNLPQELWPEGLRLLERVGRYLIRRIDASRN